MNTNLIIVIITILITVVLSLIVYKLGTSNVSVLSKEDDLHSHGLEDYDLEDYDEYSYEQAAEEHDREEASTPIFQKYWKFILPTIIVIGVLVSSLFLFRVYRDYQKVEEPEVDLVAIQNFHDSYIEDNEDDFNTTVEYGDEFVLPYDKSLLTLTSDVSTEVDTLKVGDYEFKAEFKDNDDNLHKFDYKVSVEDKVPPEISGVKNIHLDFGKPFLTSELELSAVDPIDGKVDVKAEGDINIYVADAYEVLAVAVDKNGVRAEEPFVVVVASYDNDKPIRIEGGGSDKPDTPSTPGDSTTDKPVDNPTDNPTDKPVDKPVEKPTLLPIKDVAANVIKGDYGNNPNRRTKLEAEGYNYQEVQDEVNKQLR